MELKLTDKTDQWTDENLWSNKRTRADTMMKTWNYFLNQFRIINSAILKERDMFLLEFEVLKLVAFANSYKKANVHYIKENSVAEFHCPLE